MTSRYTLTSAGEPELSLYHSPAPRDCTVSVKPVLYVHGATFPSNLSVGFKIGETSWVDDLNTACFSVWALDFAGYGFSGRYDLTNRTEPVGRSGEAQKQIARAVDFLLDKEEESRVSIIAHSWGTIPAGAYTASNSAEVYKLILFGPVAQRNGATLNSDMDLTRLVTVQAQYDRFVSETPKNHPPVLHDGHFTEWGPAYLASDPESGMYNPPAVRVPMGPVADIAAAWAGHYPYNPAGIRVPTLIVRGEWDRVTKDTDAAWLMKALSGTSIKRDIKIAKGGHLMHLESSRTTLYSTVRSFLQEIN